MRNQAFCLLTETDRNLKFRAILNTRTDGCLTDDELRSILLCISPTKQYRICVHRDSGAFRQVLQLRDGFRGKTVFGQALASHGTTPGELYDRAQSAAIILTNQADENTANELHIYLPPDLHAKGQKVL